MNWYIKDDLKLWQSLGMIVISYYNSFLVSLGGWQSGEETDQVFSTKIYRLPYDLGPGK